MDQDFKRNQQRFRHGGHYRLYTPTSVRRHSLNRRNTFGFLHFEQYHFTRPSSPRHRHHVGCWWFYHGSVLASCSDFMERQNCRNSCRWARLAWIVYAGISCGRVQCRPPISSFSCTAQQRSTWFQSHTILWYELFSLFQYFEKCLAPSFISTRCSPLFVEVWVYTCTITLIVLVARVRTVCQPNLYTSSIFCFLNITASHVINTWSQAVQYYKHFLVPNHQTDS